MKTYKIDIKVWENYYIFLKVEQYFFESDFFWVMQDGVTNCYPARNISYIEIEDEGRTQ